MLRLLPLVLAACSGEGTFPIPDIPGSGILGTGLANPYPSTELLDANGHLALSGLPDLDNAMPVERLAWRDGFSPSQVSVVRLSDVDDGNFPGHANPELGMGSVRMLDLTDGRDVLCMAELDAYPDAEERALLVRPLEALAVGHRIAVVLTTDAVERPARFAAVLSDAPPPSLADAGPRYRALMDDVVTVTGLAEADIALTWEFPVGDGRAPLTSALAQRSPSSGHTFTRIRNVDLGDTVAPYTWRAAEGTFKATQFVIGDRSLDLAPDGTVTPVGEGDVQLYVHIPDAVKDAPAGSVPVMVFGHGIFGQPSDYLDDNQDGAQLNRLANDLGMIVIATVWRGLAANDRIVPIQVAGDFSRFHELTDLLVQGQVNTRTLIDAARDGALFDDPVFQGVSGQTLPDPTHIAYYGISLGAIQGAVLLAQDAPIEAAVLHVGGASWSTMLERSSNWGPFELLVTGSVPSPADRQVLYAVSQLWWDAVDPMAHVDRLGGLPFLMQESVNDEQVPNLTTEALARSVDLPVLSPSDTVPYGLSSIAGPLPVGSRALVRFDPKDAAPPVENRPAPVTGAHGTPRTWPGTRQQVQDYLDPEAPGRVVHHCGTAMCDADNQGTD